ncbi:MAG: hypothetical protein IT460_11620 [Planctomycetes bacterium]|nr:hypothetical protein [Planctomycetota bacterium]
MAPAAPPLGRIVRWAVLVGVLAAARPAPAQDAPAAPPTLAQAFYLEKTVRDPKAAAEAFGRLADDPTQDAATRAEARLGRARCLLATGDAAGAEAAWKALEDDPTAPTAAKEEARARREELARAQRAADDAAGEARAQDAVRRAEEARAASERRREAAGELVRRAAEHVRAKRYDSAREDLIQALRLDPGDERAGALLEEVATYGDRGELLRQAMRFVATNRVVEYRRLSADVERLRKEALRLVREEQPHLAVAPLSDAIARIDESDFNAELADPRRELVALLRKAIDDARAKALPLPEGARVPADRPEGAPVKPWRREFFALLARVLDAGPDAGSSLRFYDAAVPPNPAPEARGRDFAASGVAASPAPGTLRRARFLERWVRAKVAPGTWTGRGRLLERYDDQLAVEHAPSVLREVDALVAQWPAGPPPPLRAEVRVYAAEPGGVQEALRFLEGRAPPGEPGTAVVVATHRLDEQDRFLSGLAKIRLVAQASLRLSGRHATLVRFREPTASAPGYGEAAGPGLVLAERDASYGLELDLYAEDLPGAPGTCAVSAVATVRRPDRPRVVPQANGNVRVPTFLAQTVEGDEKVPHAGSLLLLALANPFRETGAAGDPGGGTHPDLLVLVSASPDGPRAPDIARPPTTAEPAAGGVVVRELDLGALATDVADEAPPEGWPSVPFCEAAPADAVRRRDAFLAGLLAGRAGVDATSGALLVHDGRATASLAPDAHARLAREVERLLADEGRLFAVEVRSSEVPADRATAWLGEAGVPTSDVRQRLWRLDAAPAARLEERLASGADATSLYATTARLVARHTQLVTARSVRARSIVEAFRVERREGAPPRTVPVNGTAEEGLVVSVRPVASVGGLASLDVSATLARVDRLDAWTPAEVPGTAPVVSLPRHRVERAAGQGTFGEDDTMLLAIPAPGSDGARTVLVRIRHLRP